jgi:hypothetical protein
MDDTQARDQHPDTTEMEERTQAAGHPTLPFDPNPESQIYLDPLPPFVTALEREPQADSYKQEQHGLHPNQ